jgi:hypothetical protein
MRFIVYLILTQTLINASHQGSFYTALAFGLGACWNVALRRLILGEVSSDPPATRLRQAQTRPRWLKSLRTLNGWQFQMRIALGLGIANMVWHQWTAHHYAWISLTVALLTTDASVTHDCQLPGGDNPRARLKP